MNLAQDEYELLCDDLDRRRLRLGQQPHRQRAQGQGCGGAHQRPSVGIHGAALDLLLFLVVESDLNPIVAEFLGTGIGGGTARRQRYRL